jgi:hypothetical protein
MADTIERRMSFFPAGSSLGRPIASWPLLPWPRPEQAAVYGQFSESMQRMEFVRGRIARTEDGATGDAKSAFQQRK